MGKALGISKNFIDQFLGYIKTVKDILLFVDEWRTPITPHFVAKSVWEIALSNFQGILHLCGTEKINRYQLGIKIAEYLNYPADTLKKAYSDQVTSYPRPLDVSMRSLFASGILSVQQQKITDTLKEML